MNRKFFILFSLLCFITSYKLAYGITQKNIYAQADTYKTNTPFSEVEIILKDKTIDYLRTSDYEQYVITICNRINQLANNDFEKVKYTHDIVCSLLSYDAKSYWNKNIPQQNIEYILKTKLSVCEGYANLFNYFCDKLKIKCEKISGYAKGVSYSLSEAIIENTKNHAWNIVYINDNSYLIDCTWDSSSMEGKIAKKKYSTTWLFSKPEYFIYTHYPQEAKNQLLTNPISIQEFNELPYLRPNFFDVIEMNQKLYKTNTVNDSFTFSYIIKDKYSLSFVLTNTETNTSIKNTIKTQQNKTETLTTIGLPDKGIYKLSIFIKQENSNQNSEYCGDLLIIAKTGNEIYKDAPYLTPIFLENVILQENIRSTNTVDNSFLLSYVLKEGYYIKFDLREKDQKDIINNCIYTITESNNNKTYFSLPYKGIFTVSIFLYTLPEHNANISYKYGGSFSIQSEQANPIRYPIVYENTNKTSTLISPIEGPLHKGNTYQFKIFEPTKKISIFLDDKFIQLSKDDNNFFTKDIFIPEDSQKIHIGVADENSNHYTYIYTFLIE